MTRRSPFFPVALIVCSFPFAAAAQTSNGVALGPLTLTAYVQADGVFALREQPFPGIDTFRMRRARFTLTGRVTSRIDWLVSVELTAPSAPIRDVYLAFQLAPWASLRAGQFVTPFSVERLTSTSRLEAIDRVLDTITPSRDLGVTLVSDRPIGGWFGYGLALVNGAGQNNADDNDAKDIVGRITLAPPVLKHVTFGFNGATGGQVSGRRDRSGADVEVRLGRFHAMAEYIRERRDDADPAEGFFVLGAHRFGPWEAVARVSRLERDSAGDVRIDAGGNYYFAGRTRVMANLVFFPAAAGNPVGFIARLQFFV